MIIILNKWLDTTIWPIVGTPLGTTTPALSGPESNGNDGVL